MKRLENDLAEMKEESLIYSQNANSLEHQLHQTERELVISREKETVYQNKVCEI
jgi:ubiquitin-protein ligase